MTLYTIARLTVVVSLSNTPSVGFSNLELKKRGHRISCPCLKVPQTYFTKHLTIARSLMHLKVIFG